MNVLEIIFCLFLTQIVSVLGQAKGNCSDSYISGNCDVNCYNYNPGNPIQYGTCLQTVPDQYGNYNYRCTCNFLNSCPSADGNCASYCKNQNRGYSSTCIYKKQGININCACGYNNFYNDPKTYYYAQY